MIQMMMMIIELTLYKDIMMTMAGGVVVQETALELYYME